MFDTLYGFLALYGPLVALAIIGVCKEDRLIAFEQKIRKAMRAKNTERTK